MNSKSLTRQKAVEMAFLELFLHIHKKGNVFVLTSAFAGESKNYTTVMLAKTAADHNKKVLLIEADGVYDDIRRGLPPDVFNLLYMGAKYRVEPFKFDVVVLKEAYVSGSRTILAGVGEIRGKIEDLAATYDYIFIHGQPVEMSNYTCLLAGAVGKTILVIRHDRTSVQAALHTKKLLDAAGADILGTVLSDVQSRGLFNYYSMMRKRK